MTTETLRIMAGVERRMNRMINKYLSACGFPESVADARRYRETFENWLEFEIERLQENASGKPNNN